VATAQPEIVLVKKRDMRSRRRECAAIPSDRYAAVVLLDKSSADWMTFDDRRAGVGGSVVDHDHFVNAR